MRTFFFLLSTIAFSLNVETTLAQEKVKIETDKEATVDEVFHIIMDQTKYSFIYPENLFKNLPKVKLKRGTIRVAKLISLSISKKKFNVVLTQNSTIIIKEVKREQQILVSGKVTDKKGTPISGVTVLIKGTNKGTLTNINGVYKIPILSSETVLVFSIIGYIKQERVVGNNTRLDVILKEQIKELDEILLVGYGKTKKKDLTGSVNVVKSEEIMQIRTNSIDQTLVGRAAGVLVTGGGNGLGGSNVVHIRGLSQISGDNQPLYVVDGVPIIINFQSLNDFGLASNGNNENPLLAINPEDIERIDILKDASAAGIYGSRAANGVVLITTKKGRKNQKTKLTFSSSIATQQSIRQPDFLNGDEYRQFVPILAQRVLDNSPFPESIRPSRHFVEFDVVNNPDTYFGDANTDWENESFINNPLWSQYQLSASGGSEKTSFYLSAGVSNQDGIIIRHNFKRYTLAANIDTQIKSNLRIGSSINYNNSVNKQVAGLYNAASYRTDLPVFNEDGSFSGNQSFSGFARNPIGNAENASDKAISQNILATVYGEWEFYKNFKFKSQISANLQDTDSKVFSPSTSLSNLFFGSATLGVSKQKLYTTAFENTINYNGTINENHKINAVVGLSHNRVRTDFEFQSYRGFPDDVKLTDINSASEVEVFGSESVEAGINSIFGRFNYNYKDRYLATFTARSDISTKFGSNNQRGYFPSGALAWNMHNESFMKDLKIIDQLKLRASLGRTGSDNLPAFSFLSNAAVLPDRASNYDGNQGIALTGFPNPDIKWETTDQLDLGLEFGLFNNRLFGEVVYFEKNTSDLIQILPLPGQIGFSNFNANIADVSNKGWEFQLSGDIFRNKSFTWNSSFNISFIDNKVESLNGGIPRDPGLFGDAGILEGEPIGTIIGFQVERIAQTQQEIDDLNAASPDGVYYDNTRIPGDYIFKDIDGNGRINNDDRTAIGSINPDYFGGWNNTLTYKNLDFGFNFVFVEGVERYVNTNFTRLVQSGGLQREVVFDSWTPDNRDARFARFGTSSDVIFNSSNVRDASYIRLSYVGLGYNFPKKILDKINLAEARIFIQGNNLFTITDYPEGDPEAISAQLAGDSRQLRFGDSSRYPTAKMFTLGFKISL